MKHYRLFASILAFSAASCVAPLTEQQKIEGSYYCRATKDRMIFEPDGDYRYSIGGTETLWDAAYGYNTPPEKTSGLDPVVMEWAKKNYNRRGDGLYFTYAVSGHCYLNGRPRWDFPYFPHPDKRELVLISGGKERRYSRQEAGPGT